jgi:DNA-binding winged helix-turn-helix (wHTH) protein
MTDVTSETLADPAPIAPQERYRRLGDIVIDRETRSVMRDGQATRLEPRVFTLLLYFMDNPGREISRQELGERVWNGVHVVDEAIQRAISVLRQALGDTPKQGLHIQTTTGGGYRLVSEVAAVPSQALTGARDWRALAVAAALGGLLGVMTMMWMGGSDMRAPEAPPAPVAAPVGDAVAPPAP